MQQFVRQNPCFPYISDLDGVNMCQTIRVSTCFKPAFWLPNGGGGSQIQAAPGHEAAASEGGPSPRRSNAAWPAEPLWWWCQSGGHSLLEWTALCMTSMAKSTRTLWWQCTVWWSHKGLMLVLRMHGMQAFRGWKARGPVASVLPHGTSVLVTDQRGKKMKKTAAVLQEPPGNPQGIKFSIHRHCRHITSCRTHWVDSMGASSFPSSLRSAHSFGPVDGRAASGSYMRTFPGNHLMTHKKLQETCDLWWR